MTFAEKRRQYEAERQRERRKEKREMLETLARGAMLRQLLAGCTRGMVVLYLHEVTP